ncbi:Hypothetical predicted protein [Pelobates cultripes]|uniref:Uncharacterized protein n=1 Tax=Pelobates cultripes TaxID=61616 RepID=A0AAD1VVC8_PELCU|nr:Hypothetical predicted protein [Pelobates cultripes]
MSKALASAMDIMSSSISKSFMQALLQAQLSVPLASLLAKATSGAKAARQWKWAKTQSESELSENEESALESESDHSDDLSDLDSEYKFEEDKTTPQCMNATELSHPAISKEGKILSPQGEPLFDPDDLSQPCSANWSPAEHVARYIAARVRKPLDKVTRSKLQVECLHPTVPNDVCKTPHVNPKIIQFLGKTGWKPKKVLYFSLCNCQDKVLDILGPATKTSEL